MTITTMTAVGARRRAQDRVAQVHLTEALLVGLIYYQDARDFKRFDVSFGMQEDPTLGWIGSGGPDGGTPDPGEIKIEVADDDQLLLVGQSRSGTFLHRSVRRRPADQGS